MGHMVVVGKGRGGVVGHDLGNLVPVGNTSCSVAPYVVGVVVAAMNLGLMRIAPRMILFGVLFHCCCCWMRNPFFGPLSR